MKTQGMTLEQVGERIATLEKLTASNTAQIVMLQMKAKRIKAEIDLDEEELEILRRHAAVMVKAKVEASKATAHGDSQGVSA